MMPVVQTAGFTEGKPSEIIRMSSMADRKGVLDAIMKGGSPVAVKVYYSNLDLNTRTAITSQRKP